MKVFIENESGKAIKNIFDERSLTYLKSYPVSTPYPYPYGFVIGTLSGDGDCLDCFVITDKPLHIKDQVEAEPLSLMEMKEDDKIDHKVIARLQDENRNLDQETKNQFVSFLQSVFAHLEGKKIGVGRFLSKDMALMFLKESEEAFHRSNTSK